MKTLQEIQKEHREWSLKNFGEHPTWHPLLGIQEEIGELAHAYLKREQGIRGTREEHDAAIKDAVGDVMIYLMGYCSCWDSVLWLPAPPPRGRAKSYGGDQDVDNLFYLGWSLGEICQNEITVGPPTEQQLRDFVDILLDFCETQDIDLLTVVNETWDRVSKRDWTKNKVDGGAA